MPSHCLARPPVKKVPLSPRPDVLSLSDGGWELSKNFPPPSVKAMRPQPWLGAEQCRRQLIHSGDFRQTWLS